MNSLFTADLHLSNKESEEYRWLILPYLKKVAKQRGVDRVFVLGDLTQQKDNHSGKFVSRMVEALEDLSEAVDIHIVKGNHDYTDPMSPFFGFVGRFPKIHYHPEPIQLNFDSGSTPVLVLPHTRDYKKDWVLKKDINKRLKYILIHQCVKGAVTENGTVMDGVPLSFFDRVDKGTTILAGDIHVPQKVGRVEYIGAPYPVHFGDNFKPRILYISSGGEHKDIIPPAIRRMKVKVTHPDKLNDVEMDPGDHVRVVLSLYRSQFHECNELKKRIVELCDDREVVLFGVEVKERKRTMINTTDAPKGLLTRSDDEVFETFCDGRKDIDEYIHSVGKELLV